MNEELQRGIVGDFLVDCRDWSQMQAFVRRYGLLPRHFTDPVTRTAFETVLAAETADRLVLAQELSAKLGVEQVEGFIARASLTLVDAEARIRRLANEGVLSEARELTERKMRELNGKASANFILSDISRELAVLADRQDAGAGDDGYSLADLSDPIPEEDDPDALFKNRWLCKGGAAFLTSVSGSGKSVVTMQLAYAWACGKPALGIRPLRPLKIAIFQTEDDDEELKTFRMSMRTGYRTLHGWTDLEIAAAERNIRFYDTKGRTGEGFVGRLREVQTRGHFDLVVINPFQGVTGFDIAQNALLTKFLREGLDSVIKDEKVKCGLFVIHHTNKPPSARDRGGFGKDQFAEYVGAGGAELTNWMRAMLAIMPTTEAGVYQLVAAKRGKRLGWPDNPAAKCPLPSRFIRHSDWNTEHMLFWKEATGASVVAHEPTGPDPKADAERLARDLAKVPRTLTEARKYATELFGKSKGRNEAAFEALTANPGAYGLVIERTGIGTQSLIGSAEGVENEISSLREKQAQKLLAKVAKK